MRRRSAPCSEWAIDRVHAAEGAAGGAQLPAGGARRQDVVGGHHPRPGRGQQQRVEAGQGQPLVMGDVGAGGAAEAQHVRQVLGELEGAAGGGVEAAPGAAPIEALLDPVALRLRHRAVEEAAGRQLDLGTGAGERRGERAVVRRRERRGVDELHPDLVSGIRHTCGRLSCARGANALLLRREHERPRGPARLSRGDRGHPSGRRRARDPRPRQRLDRRIGRRGAGAGGRHPADRAPSGGPARRPTTRPCSPRRGGATACCSTRTRSCGRGRPRRCSGRSTPNRPPARRGRSCSTPTASRSPARGASRGSARRWSAPCSCTACSPCRAGERRRGKSTGPSRAPCSCAARRRPRSATSTPTSSSTTTSATSANDSPKPGIGRSSSPPPRPSTTTSSPPTSPPGCRGSSNSTAIAIATCASTTRAPAALAVRLLTAWSYALRALAATVLPDRPARIYWAHARQALLPNRGSGLRDL